ncbi:hypothetical protein LJK88_35185 [Paenibacillus sp. P26]|nr:hypothetical protein LJK88_35185 [Paenibacillus sp. P26]UUZ93706.1 hypothetical protein LJK87_03005 [Paenibacillus sp. P25]
MANKLAAVLSLIMASGVVMAGCSESGSQDGEPAAPVREIRVKAGRKFN